MSTNVTDISKVLTTASFRITFGQKVWVEEEAERRSSAQGQKVYQSDVVQEVLDRAMRDEPNADLDDREAA